MDDWLSVPLHSFKFLRVVAGRPVVDPDDAVLRPAGEPAPVRGELERVDRTEVPGDVG